MHSANSSVILPSAVVPPVDVQLLAHVRQQFLAAAQRAGQAAADPEPRLAERVLLVAEEAVEGQRVVDLGGAEVEHLGDLADRLERHAAQRVVDQVQRRQRHRLLAADSAAGSLDLLRNSSSERACSFASAAAQAHRSSSAAMMFKLPSTATTSLS